MYCFIARTLLKFDPVTCPGVASLLPRERKRKGERETEISAPPRDIRRDNRARVVLLIKDPSREGVPATLLGRPDVEETRN